MNTYFNHVYHAQMQKHVLAALQSETRFRAQAFTSRHVSQVQVISKLVKRETRFYYTGMRNMSSFVRNTHTPLYAHRDADFARNG